MPSHKDHVLSIIALGNTELMPKKDEVVTQISIVSDFPNSVKS